MMNVSRFHSVYKHFFLLREWENFLFCLVFFVSLLCSGEKSRMKKSALLIKKHNEETLIIDDENGMKKKTLYS